MLYTDEADISILELRWFSVELEIYEGYNDPGRRKLIVNKSTDKSWQKELIECDKITDRSWQKLVKTENYKNYTWADKSLNWV